MSVSLKRYVRATNASDALYQVLYGLSHSSADWLATAKSEDQPGLPFSVTVVEEPEPPSSLNGSPPAVLWHFSYDLVLDDFSVHQAIEQNDPTRTYIQWSRGSLASVAGYIMSTYRPHRAMIVQYMLETFGIVVPEP